MIKKIIFGTSLSLLSTIAFAQPSYNYVDLGYETLDLDGIDYKASGFSLAGSYDFGNGYFAEASYQSLEDDITVGAITISPEIERTDLNVGAYFDLGTNTSWHVKGGYVDYSFSALGVGVDGDGWLIGAGIRSNVTEQIELNASVDYEDVESESMQVYKIGALYHATSNLGLFLEAGRNDDSDTYFGLGGRFKF